MNKDEALKFLLKTFTLCIYQFTPDLSSSKLEDYKLWVRTFIGNKFPQIIEALNIKNLYNMYNIDYKFMTSHKLNQDIGHLNFNNLNINTDEEKIIRFFVLMYSDAKIKC